MTTTPTFPLQLPPTHLVVAEQEYTVNRAWPHPRKDTALTVELDSASGLRAGIWQDQQLKLLAPGTDPKLPLLEQLLQGANPWGQLVSHRAGKRAVVKNTEGNCYRKIVRPGRGPDIVEGIRRSTPFAESFVTPEVLHVDESSVELSALPGRSLHIPGNFTPQEWTQAWSETCEAWEMAGNHTPSAVPEEFLHTARDEATVLRRWLDLATPWIPDATEAASAVAQVSALLHQQPASQPRISHRDLHDLQLLWSPDEGPGLLDVDTTCYADPALDLGNLRAHATLRRLQDLWAPGEAETVTFCVDLAAERLAVPRSALAVYEQATLLRLGFVYAVRPGQTEVAATLRHMFYS